MALLPSPATALPMIKTNDEFAAPHIALPTSKSTMPDKNTGLVGKNVYTRPYNRMKPQAVNMYALPYQPTSESEWNWFVIAGIAGPIIVRSRATRKIEM